MFSIIILSFRKTTAPLFVILLSFVGLFYIFIFKHVGAVRHHGLILIMLIFTMWISRHYNNLLKKPFEITSKMTFSNPSMIIINACLALSLLYALYIQYAEYRYPFSGAKAMAAFIKRKQLDNYTVIAHQSFGAIALLPYLPKKSFWYAGIKEYGTFITYNTKYLAGKAISNEQVISRIEQTFSNKSQLLLLLTSPLDYPESHGFRLLHKVDKDIFGYGPEKFYLYKPFDQEQ